MAGFDVYHKWLGIAPKDQPPHHYRLLGVELFESDPDVIDAATEQRTLYIQRCATGPYLAESQRLLNEIAAARLALLNPAERQQYDAWLQQRLDANKSPPVSNSADSDLDSERSVGRAPRGENEANHTNRLPAAKRALRYPSRFAAFVGLWAVVVTVLGLWVLNDRPEDEAALPLVEAAVADQVVPTAAELFRADEKRLREKRPSSPSRQVRLANILDQSLLPGEELDFRIHAVVLGEQAEKLKFRLGTGAPAGVKLDTDTGRLTWSPTRENAGKAYVVPIEVYFDDEGTPVGTTSFQVAIAAAGDYQASDSDAPPPIVQGRPVRDWILQVEDERRKNIRSAWPALRTAARENPAALTAILRHVNRYAPPGADPLQQFNSDGLGQLIDENAANLGQDTRSDSETTSWRQLPRSRKFAIWVTNISLVHQSRDGTIKYADLEGHALRHTESRWAASAALGHMVLLNSVMPFEEGLRTSSSDVQYCVIWGLSLRLSGRLTHLSGLSSAEDLRRDFATEIKKTPGLLSRLNGLLVSQDLNVRYAVAFLLVQLPSLYSGERSEDSLQMVGRMNSVFMEMLNDERDSEYKRRAMVLLGRMSQQLPEQYAHIKSLPEQRGETIAGAAPANERASSKDFIQQSIAQLEGSYRSYYRKSTDAALLSTFQSTWNSIIQAAGKHPLVVRELLKHAGRYSKTEPLVQPDGRVMGSEGKDRQPNPLDDFDSEGVSVSTHIPEVPILSDMVFFPRGRRAFRDPGSAWQGLASAVKSECWASLLSQIRAEHQSEYREAMRRPETRWIAARSLARAGAVDVLVDCLDDRDPQTQYCALWALSYCWSRSHEGEPPGPGLGRYPSGSSDEYLRLVTPYSPRGMEKKSYFAFERWEPVSKTRFPPVAKPVGALLQSPEKNVRYAAAHFVCQLEELGAKWDEQLPEQVLPVLIEMLGENEERHEYRQRAVWLLAEHDLHAGPAAAALGKAGLAERDTKTYQEICLILSRVKAVNDLVTLVKGTEPREAAIAAKFLGDLGPIMTAEGIEALIVALDKPLVCQAAVVALSKCGPNAASAIPTLTKLLDDPKVPAGTKHYITKTIARLTSDPQSVSTPGG